MDTTSMRDLGAELRPDVDIAAIAKAVRQARVAVEDAERVENRSVEQAVKAKQDADRARLDLGRRLCEARKAWPARGPKAKGWGDFLRDQGIEERSARRWMELAGYVEEVSDTLAPVSETSMAAGPTSLVAVGEREILERAREIRAERQEERRTERVARIEQIARGNEPLALVTNYPVIYADPPWRYEAGTAHPGDEIENHYPTMTIEDICALPVGDIATADAVLYLWHPPGMATEAVKVATAWGFRERSSWTWVKPSIGPGYWGRLRHEMVMICTRGDFPAPAPSDRFDSVIEAPRGDHSAKPSVVAERIERMFPTLPRIELFARTPRPGWEAWGNQAQARLAVG